MNGMYAMSREQLTRAYDQAIDKEALAVAERLAFLLAFGRHKQFVPPLTEQEIRAA